MKTVDMTIYKYSELDDYAQGKAREWFSSGGYTWIDEGIYESASEAFEIFGEEQL
jgi:hypothetical protein